MRCAHPVVVHPNPAAFPRGLSVPCGKCRFCLMSKRREWSLRCYHELDAWSGKASFVTLTYTEATLPYSSSLLPTLNKKDVQDWLKRVRKNISYLPIKNRSTGPENEVLRYFLAGEYGDNTNRPHYHAILYGINCTKESEAFIRETWKNGFITMLPANYESIKYVAAYIDKKTYDQQYLQQLKELGVEPLFKLSSKGLGKYWIDKNINKVKDVGLRLPDGTRVTFPRYYVNRHKSDINLMSFKNYMKENQRKKNYDVTGMTITDEELRRYVDTVNTSLHAVEEQIYAAKAADSLQTDRNLKGQQKLKVRDF